MSAISVSKGWLIFLRSLREPLSIVNAAAWMYRLNVFARHMGRQPIVDQVYALKNELVKYLYQHGYATEVVLHQQKRACFSCDGTGTHWSGDDCWKCGGTGVFSVTELYAFR